MSRDAWTKKNAALQSIVDPEARAFMDAAKGQLLIAAINRLGGSIAFPVSEVDGTGAFNLALRLTEQNEIYLETQRKQ